MAIGQDEFQDFETWYRYRARTKFNDEIRFYLSPGLRLNENSTQFKVLFSDFSSSYKVHKYLRTKLNYRYSLRNRYDRSPYSSHRVNFDIKSDVDIGEFNFDVRERLQYDYNIYSRGWTNRARLTVTYEMGKEVDFYGATEAFFDLNEVEKFDSYRFAFGFDIELKNNDVSIFYMRQASMASNVPTKQNVIGIVYKMKFKSLF